MSSDSMKNSSYSFMTVQNVNEYVCETISSSKMSVHNWNMSVQWWLASNVYRYKTNSIIFFVSITMSIFIIVFLKPCSLQTNPWVWKLNLLKVSILKILIILLVKLSYNNVCQRLMAWSISWILLNIFIFDTNCICWKFNGKSCKKSLKWTIPSNLWFIKFYFQTH